MSKKVKFDALKKLQILEEVDKGEKKVSEICSIYGFERTSLKRWRIKYKIHGIYGLNEITKKVVYSHKTKLNAVLDYLSSDYTMLQIVEKYDLSSDAVLRYWLMLYNNNKLVKKKRKYIMNNKNFKIDIDKKIEIVLECISQNNDYIAISEKYGISYQKLYQWVKKYKINGKEELIDKRGKNKPIKDMDINEKEKLKLKDLQDENRRLKMEVDFLKKLNKI